MSGESFLRTVSCGDVQGTDSTIPSVCEFLFETTGGEKVYREENSVFVTFPKNRRTLTTSWLNGGFREDLHCIFNHKIPDTALGSHELEGGSVEEYLRIISRGMGLDPERTSGLLTGASMKNVTITTRSFRGLEVTAVITGGIEVNGGRAGDPASYYQEDSRYEPIGGTINIILLIGASLPEFAMTRVLMTVTEAKSVVLQQLMASSRYSDGIATGSGTDMIAVVADGSSPLELTDAGKHSKLGELTGTVVIEGLQKALSLQSELTPLSQRDMMVRLERFGVDEARYWKVASGIPGENKKARFINDLRTISHNPVLVSCVASVLHIVDEVKWGLIPENSGKKAAIAMMRELPQLLGATEELPVEYLEYIFNEKESILDTWVLITAWMVKNGNCNVLKGLSERY